MMTNRLAPAIPHAALQLMLVLATIATAVVLLATGTAGLLADLVDDAALLGNGGWTG